MTILVLNILVIIPTTMLAILLGLLLALSAVFVQGLCVYHGTIAVFYILKREAANSYPFTKKIIAILAEIAYRIPSWVALLLALLIASQQYFYAIETTPAFQPQKGFLFTIASRAPPHSSSMY